MSYYISPSSTTQTFPGSTAVTDKNLSTTATDDAAGLRNDGSDDKIMLFIIVAIVPTIILLVLIAVVLARRAREKGSREPFFKIQVEYNDKPRRPRSSNSRLDMTINGMQIDVEYDASPTDKRVSRLSSTSFISDAEQVRELHKLSQECKENLVRIHEMLERELEPATSSEPPSPSHNSELACTNNRDSVYSSSSEMEKGSHEPSEKEIKRSNSSTKDSAEKDALFLSNDYGDFIDSVFNSSENEDCVNITPVKPHKPTPPPKPSMKKGALIAEQPKPAPRVNKQTSKQDKSSQNQHLSVVFPVPKNRTRRLARESLKTEEKPTVVRRRPDVPKRTVGRDNCTFEKKGKPPIPKKPEGLVIKITKRTPSEENKKQTVVKTKLTSKSSHCDNV